MEKDKELKGDGNSYTTEFRQYDPRLGRWLSVDPLAHQASGWTPYRFSFNNPLTYTDKTGLYETKSEARKARRKAEKDGYETFEITGKKGHFGFNALKGRENITFITKYGDHEYKLSKSRVEFFNKYLPEKDRVQVSGFTVLGLFIDDDYFFSKEKYEKLTSGYNFYKKMEMSLPVGLRPSAQGGATPCDGFWQGFIGIPFRGGAVALTTVGGINSNKGIVVTEDIVRGAMQNAEFRTQQTAVSLPKIQEFVNRSLNGSVAPAIEVRESNLIIEGNHRYIVDRILGRPSNVIKNNTFYEDPVVPWDKVFLDPKKW